MFSVLISFFFHSEHYIDNSNKVIIPVVFIFSIFCFLKLSKNTVLKIINVYPVICLFFCYLLLLHTLLFGSPPSWIIPEDGIDRFSGLSKNPNQLALSILPIPFFSIIAYIEGMKRKKIVILELLAVFFLNFLVVGKGVLVAWFMSFAFLFIIKFQFREKIRINLNFINLRIIYISAILIFCFILFYFLYTGAFPGSQEDQGGIRLHLWRSGFFAWMDSPFLGHGPGHYSGLFSPYEGMESHNLIIDWLSAYGIFGFFIFFIFIFHTIILAFLKYDWIILGFIASLLIQSMFHFYGRQPIFWLWWVFIIFLIPHSSGAKSDRKNA